MSDNQITDINYYTMEPDKYKYSNLFYKKW